MKYIALLFISIYTSNFGKSYQAVALEMSRPISVVLKNNQICLETNVYRFQSSPSSVILDLYSMVHIGDGEYYNRINSLMKDYDVVLYELITSKHNMQSTDDYKKQLSCEILPSKASQDLANKFSLQSQLSLPLQSKNWYLP
jgi:uncharacterized protein with NAD-binding domain and iron-sulfur cluster